MKSAESENNFLKLNKCLIIVALILQKFCSMGLWLAMKVVLNDCIFIYCFLHFLLTPLFFCPLCSLLDILHVSVCFFFSFLCFFPSYFFSFPLLGDCGSGDKSGHLVGQVGDWIPDCSSLHVKVSLDKLPLRSLECEYFHIAFTWHVFLHSFVYQSDGGKTCHSYLIFASALFARSIHAVHGSIINSQSIQIPTTFLELTLGWAVVFVFISSYCIIIRIYDRHI